MHEIARDASKIKTEGWDALAEVLGVLRTISSEASVPSVELAVDSKGMVKPTVKTYDPDPYTAMRVTEDIFNQLRERYGLV